MEISLYGGTGFIGSNFIKKFKDIDSIITISREMKVPRTYSEILYLISTTDNYNVFDDVTLDVRTNLLALTERLAAWQYNNPKGTFNFVSSWFVYGNNGEEISSENSPCNPSGFYSITKHCAEKLVESFAKSYKLNYRILRLCNVIGPGDKNVSKKKNALQNLINEMKKGNSIDIYGTGDFYRNYMYVTDVCEAIRLVMEKSEKNQIYNIGYPHNQRFIDMIYMAAHYTNYDMKKINEVKSSGFHDIVQVKSFKMNTQKLQNLEFQPKLNVPKMIQSCINS